MNALERELLAYIRRMARGPRRAIKAKNLAEALGLDDPEGRQVREMINRIRLAGEPICSETGTNPGFFWPLSGQETEHTLATLISRENKIREVRRGFQRGRERYFGPPNLFDLMEKEAG